MLLNTALPQVDGLPTATYLSRLLLPVNLRIIYQSTYHLSTREGQIDQIKPGGYQASHHNPA